MVYQTNSMKLKLLSVILTAKTNDVLLCRRIADLGQENADDSSNQSFIGIRNSGQTRSLEQYLLWVLKDRKVIRYLLQTENELFWLECFPYGESLCIVLPYREHRSLLKFWKAEVSGGEEKKELYRGVITLCMTVRLPYPILYLLLTQRQISIHRDGTVYFTYELDFSELDGQISERDCVEACVRLLQTLSDPEDKEEHRMFELMEKKLARKHEQSFLDLYLDWKRPEVRGMGWRLSEKAHVRLFHILTIIAALLLVLLAVIVVSQLAFGEVPLFRMFMDTFRRIGTEILGR